MKHFILAALVMLTVCRMPTCQLLRLAEPYLEGSDGACIAAGMLILRQFELNPKLEQVVIINSGWFPSAFRVIDKTWARCLADEDPRQECENYDPGFYFDGPIEALTGE